MTSTLLGMVAPFRFLGYLDIKMEKVTKCLVITIIIFIIANKYFYIFYV